MVSRAPPAVKEGGEIGEIAIAGSVRSNVKYQRSRHLVTWWLSSATDQGGIVVEPVLEIMAGPIPFEGVGEVLVVIYFSNCLLG